MTAVVRNEKGHILPGQRSLNPAGRRPLDEEVRAIFEAAAPAAAKRLVELAFDAKDPKIGLAACEMILSRLFGRPAMQINANVKTTSVQEAHLKALLDIQETRRLRLLELAPEKIEN